MNFLPLFSIVVFVIIVGIVFILSPTLRPQIFFGCTVSDSFTTSLIARRSLLRYRIEQVSLLVLAIIGLILLRSSTNFVPSWSITALLFGYFLLASCSWLLAYFRTRPYSTGILPVHTTHIATGHHEDGILAAAFLPLVAAAIILTFNWPNLPLTFPRRWGTDGLPTEVVQRSVISIFGPLLPPVVILVMFWIMLRYLPMRSGLRWVLPASGWYVSVLGAGTALLPLRNEPFTQPVLLLFLGPAMLLCIVAIIISAHFKTPSLERGDGTPDQCWRYGIFYYNPSDPALWVEKRIGIGWTLNFARPASWLILSAILLIILLTVIQAAKAHT